MTPRNTNLVGFKYPDRVYFFIDKTDVELMATGYALLSKKKNKVFIDKKRLEKMAKSEL